VHRKTRVFLEPSSHYRMFVRGVVISDQMQVELARRLAIDLLEKTQPFDVSMARLGARCRVVSNAATRA
jgi:hypothetical protein